MGCLKLAYYKNKSPLKVGHGSFEVSEKSGAGGNRYGFGVQEKDNEVKGNGNSVDFGARIHDSLFGSFLRVDPKWYLFNDLSAYSFAANIPIKFVDVKGEIAGVKVNQTTKTIIINANYYRCKDNFESFNRADKAAKYFNGITLYKRCGFFYKYNDKEPAYKVLFQLTVFLSEDTCRDARRDQIGNSFAIDDDYIDQCNSRKNSIALGITENGQQIIVKSSSIQNSEVDIHEELHVLGLGHYGIGLMLESYNKFKQTAILVGYVNEILNEAVISNSIDRSLNPEEAPLINEARAVPLIEFKPIGVNKSIFFDACNFILSTVENYKTTSNPNYTKPN